MERSGEPRRQRPLGHDPGEPRPLPSTSHNPRRTHPARRRQSRTARDQSKHPRHTSASDHRWRARCWGDPQRRCTPSSSIDRHRRRTLRRSRTHRRRITPSLQYPTGRHLDRVRPNGSRERLGALPKPLQSHLRRPHRDNDRRKRHSPQNTLGLPTPSHRPIAGLDTDAGPAG